MPLVDDDPAIQRLYRAVVRMPDYVLELSNLFGRRADRFIQYHPANAFGAGWRGQRTAEAIEVELLRQQGTDIQRSAQHRGLIDGSRYLLRAFANCAFALHGWNINASTASSPSLPL